MSENENMALDNDKIYACRKNMIKANRLALHLFINQCEEKISYGEFLEIITGVSMQFIDDTIIDDEYISDTEPKKAFLEVFIKALQDKLDIINACETKGPGIIDAIKKLGAKEDA